MLLRCIFNEMLSKEDMYKLNANVLLKQGFWYKAIERKLN